MPAWPRTQTAIFYTALAEDGEYARHPVGTIPRWIDSFASPAPRLDCDRGDNI